MKLQMIGHQYDLQYKKKHYRNAYKENKNTLINTIL